jgi:hypothetical protein
MKRALIASLLAALALPASASALDPGVQRITYRYPINLKPGTNLIRINAGVPKPTVPGYIVRIAPNLTRRDGSIPPTDQIHLHHAVWLSTGGRNPTNPGLPAEIFFATGEEKTIVTMPRPYGYRVDPGDNWILNDMIHDLTNRGARLYLTWTVDFVPAASTLGRRMRPVNIAWMDVMSGHAYPVFDVLRGSGTNGRYTFPDQQRNAYARFGTRLNEWRVNRPGTLVGCFGHVHPGGLYTDLRLRRGGRSKLLFRSEAKYFGGRPPVSWDLAMTGTPRDWRVRLQRGDVLSVHATYETRRASWYESMGIMPCALAGDATGKNPFTSPVATRGAVTHGHLRENDNFGGTRTGIPDPTRLPSGQAPGGVVPIGNFRYRYGDLLGAGAARNPPVVAQGSSLQFVNRDAGADVFHTVTGCRLPCNRSTGIGYPLANGAIFDSGQLGFGPRGLTAAANRDTWQTPPNLRPGTYSYLCRVHPFMRGTFRVVPVRG